MSNALEIQLVVLLNTIVDSCYPKKFIHRRMNIIFKVYHEWRFNKVTASEFVKIRDKLIRAVSFEYIESMKKDSPLDNGFINFFSNTLVLKEHGEFWLKQNQHVLKYKSIVSVNDLKTPESYKAWYNYSDGVNWTNQLMGNILSSIWFNVNQALIYGRVRFDVLMQKNNIYLLLFKLLSERVDPAVAFNKISLEANKIVGYYYLLHDILDKVIVELSLGNKLATDIVLYTERNYILTQLGYANSDYISQLQDIIKINRSFT